MYSSKLFLLMMDLLNLAGNPFRKSWLRPCHEFQDCSLGQIVFTVLQALFAMLNKNTWGEKVQGQSEATLQGAAKRFDIS